MAHVGVVVVGSLNVDLHLWLERHPLPGETLLAGGGTLSPGGKGANQACAAALAGAPTAMLGAVGSDDSRHTALRLLSEAGVDIDHVLQLPGPTGLAVVSVASDGENTVVVVSGANAQVSVQHAEQWAALIRAADIVVSQGEIPAEVTERVARMVQGRWLLNLAPVIDLAPDVIRRADPLVVNEHEAEAVLRQLGAEAAGPEALVAALRDQGVASVVLTLGAQGALVARDAGVARVGTPHVRAVDTVGAGDAFVGALAARLSEGVDLVAAAEYAARFAAYTVQFEGAQSSYPAPGTPLPELT
ncbi:ribokinase [Tessaracoccus lapidicaptus]|uniref:Ribokinase n=1 Tax=Tessaracoccus lapidicaptus TaxID=1427523 RepID=A0A1C0AIN4_9ACTN|nr:ribokinase [Tessaracoccus sp. T2.5-30]OCL31946.1 ribokinase [Tessaracoccus lapidicaptus]VEP40047.1 Bifunctional ribokinase/ribose-5-phosphate isomerase A [Tessaracoccus lapidicaptus]